MRQYHDLRRATLWQHFLNKGSEKTALIHVTIYAEKEHYFADAIDDFSLLRRN